MTLADLHHASEPERALETLLKWNGISGWEREVRFAPPRRFRADFLWFHPHNLIVEVEGGAYISGRHTRGAGFESGCEKQAEAVLRGYRVLRVTPRQITTGQAVSWIKRALA